MVEVRGLLETNLEQKGKPVAYASGSYVGDTAEYQKVYLNGFEVGGIRFSGRAEKVNGEWQVVEPFVAEKDGKVHELNVDKHFLERVCRCVFWAPERELGRALSSRLGIKGEDVPKASLLQKGGIQAEIIQDGQKVAEVSARIGYDGKVRPEKIDIEGLNVGRAGDFSGTFYYSALKEWGSVNTMVGDKEFNPNLDPTSPVSASLNRIFVNTVKLSFADDNPFSENYGGKLIEEIEESFNDIAATVGEELSQTRTKTVARRR